MSDAHTKPVMEAQLVDVAQSKGEQFLEQHFKKIVIAFALLAVALSTIFVSRQLQAQTELEAAKQFTSATTVEDCEIIIQKYPGTVAAGNAVLTKADLLWQSDKKTESLTEMSSFIKENTTHTLRPYAMLALASKQAATNDNTSARKTLDELLKAYPKSEVAAGAQALTGDLLWSEGKVEEAKKIFEGLPRNYPGSPFLGETEERLKMMNSGLPMVELDPPPAPPAPVPVVPPTAPVLPELKVPATPSLIPVPTPKAPAPTIPVPAAPEAKTPVTAPATPPAVPAPPVAPTPPAPEAKAPEAGK